MRLPGLDGVDLWLFPIADLTCAERALHHSLLSADERARATRFVVPDARDQFTAARALLRAVLSSYTGLSPLIWCWSTNPYGRPLLAQPEPFRSINFNLSHTDGLVACAIGETHQVGVDAENQLRDLDFKGLSQAFFSRFEAQWLQSLEGSALREAFYACWTLKEAYAKARGTGMSLPFDSFWFELGHETPRLFCDERCADDPARWHFFRWTTGNHTIALATEAGEGGPPNLRVRWVRQVSDIMQSNAMA